MKYVMAQLKDGKRCRVGIKDLGLRRYRKGSPHYATAIEIKGKRHYLRLDRALVDQYGEQLLRAEMRKFLRSFGIKPASVVK